MTRFTLLLNNKILSYNKYNQTVPPLVSLRQAADAIKTKLQVQLLAKAETEKVNNRWSVKVLKLGLRQVLGLAQHNAHLGISTVTWGEGRKKNYTNYDTDENHTSDNFFQFRHVVVPFNKVCVALSGPNK